MLVKFSAFPRSGQSDAVPDCRRDTTTPALMGKSNCLASSAASFTVPIMKQIRGWSLALVNGVVCAAGAVESPPVSPEEALNLFSLDEGYAVELVAAEPLTRDPVALDWGFDGKLWVVEMADYPYGLDGEGKPGGRVRYLTDEDGDGRMDTSTLFLEGLSFPTSVMAWREGVLISAAPDILYAEDSDGDGKADKREVLFTGFMEGNQQLRLNGLRWGLDNWVYAASGGHHAGFGAENRIRNVSTGQEVALGSGDLRFDPARQVLERVAGPSQFGRVRDDWGNWFGVQNSYPLWHVVLEEAYLKRNPHVTIPDFRKQLRGQQPRVFGAKAPQKRFHGHDHVGRYTSACGPGIYRDDWLFPREEGRTHAFTCEPFSNLVQHHQLKKSGVSFEGARAPSKSKTDFLASADRWCRPVMTRTGPDGALWVVDMYRYMIEHPDWLPESGREELKPFYRHGEDRGRIYRVVLQEKKAKAIPELVRESPKSLVNFLTDSNGVVRDGAQRLLVAGEGRDAVAPLTEMVQGHSDPRARLHALATLNGLGVLDEQTLLSGLGDASAAVRRHAIRLAETLDPVGEKVRRAVHALVEDADAAVRLQVACTLGFWPDGESSKALVRLAQRPETDTHTTAAILSSALLHYDALVASAESLRHHESLLQGLLSMAPEYPEMKDILLDKIFCQERENPTAMEFRLLAHWLGLPGASAESKVPSFPDVLRAAREAADDETLSLEKRRAAIGLLGRSSEFWAEEQPILERCLQPQVPFEVQRAAMESLRRSRDSAVPALLLDRWHHLSPKLRAAALEILLERDPWVSSLIDGLREGELTPRDFNASQRQRMLERVPEAAEWLQVPPGREEVLQGRAGALALAGRVEPGREIFAERCALCHQVGDLGVALGPDLRALTNRSAEAVYAAILDPNRAVDPLYLAFTATTISGDVVHGLLKSETGNTLTFHQLDGRERQLLRSQVETLSGSGLSLMPEGLEAGLSDQALADLIAFVQTIK